MDDESDHKSPAKETPKEQSNIELVAATGFISTYPWPDLKSSILSKFQDTLDQYIEKMQVNMEVQGNQSSSNLDSIINEFHEEGKNLSNILKEMDEPPFTIQRICELLHEPTRYYDKIDKFLRAMEKNFRVVSPYEEPKV